MKKTSLLAFLVLIGLVPVSAVSAVPVAPVPARAETGAAGAVSAPEVKAVRVAVGPKIDGTLADPAWASAVTFGDFRMFEPQAGGVPTEKTELRVLYDDANLYIGVRCFDAEPGRIAANTMAHDAGGSPGGGFFHGAPQGPSDDIVRILLDPFQDKRTAFIFYLNPLGARSEGLVYAGSASLNWDGIWEAKSRILDDGWGAEIRIPFKSISFNPGLDAWGINVERVIARKQETIRLSGTNLDSNFNNPNEAAVLQGIAGIKQGLGVTFRPYGLTGVTKDGPGASTQGKLDGGFDIYKSFTPSLVGAVSYNMDFAETEVDERRINLTRFPINFPEKRMFFLEGSEVFSFSSSMSFTPFISRKIGLVQGEQIPVLFGSKLYGRIGDTSLAAIDVQTGAFEGLPGRNLLAARVVRNVFAQSKVGLIFTNGSPTGEKNSLIGADFNFSSSKFLGNKNIMLTAWGAYNWNEKTEGRHHGFGFRADLPNDLWNLQTTYAYYGEALDPGLGYMMRKGIQTGYVRLAYQPRPAGGWLDSFIRQFFFQGSADYYWDLSGNLQTRHLSLSPLSFRTESGERFSISANLNRDVLPYDFEVARGVVLPAKGYDYASYSVSFNTAIRRPAVLDLSYNFGRFYSGNLDEWQIGLTLKLSGTASLSFNADIIRGRLPEGRFNENVFQVKADIYLSPDLGLMNYIQYDDVSRQLGWSSRLRWQISPGNEIYLVFNKNWERRWDPASRFDPLAEHGVLKISLSVRP
jgi:hypothetical protein